MCQRRVTLFVAVVLVVLCGVSASQEDVSALIRQLKDHDDEFVDSSNPMSDQVLVEAFIQIGPAAVPALVALLKDKDRWVRRRGLVQVCPFPPWCRARQQRPRGRSPSRSTLPQEMKSVPSLPFPRFAGFRHPRCVYLVNHSLRQSHTVTERSPDACAWEPAKPHAPWG